MCGDFREKHDNISGSLCYCAFLFENVCAFVKLAAFTAASLPREREQETVYDTMGSADRIIPGKRV